MEEGLAVAFALLVGHLSANRVHLFVHPSVVAGHHQQTVAQVHAFPFSSRSYRSTAMFTPQKARGCGGFPLPGRRGAARQCLCPARWLQSLRQELSPRKCSVIVPLQADRLRYISEATT